MKFVIIFALVVLMGAGCGTKVADVVPSPLAPHPTLSREERGAETGGERKHLHFGIHKGARVDLRGYVENKSELDQWLDPWQYISTK